MPIDVPMRFETEQMLWTVERCFMRRRGLPLALLALTPNAVAAAPEPLSFTVPDGFVDITHETKPPLSAIDDVFYDLAKSLDFMAVKVLDGTVIAACSAKITDGRAPIKSLAAAIKEAQGQLPPNTSFNVLATSTVKLAGVDCGRVEAELTTPDGIARVLAFVLPSDERWAQIELTVFDAADYAEIASAFEAAVARTRGIAPAKPPDDPPMPFVAKLGLVALIGSVIGKWLRGRKRSTAWRQSQSPRGD